MEGITKVFFLEEQHLYIRNVPQFILKMSVSSGQYYVIYKWLKIKKILNHKWHWMKFHIKFQHLKRILVYNRYIYYKWDLYVTRDRLGHDCMIVRFITTYAISAYHH